MATRYDFSGLLAEDSRVTAVNVNSNTFVLIKAKLEVVTCSSASEIVTRSKGDKVQGKNKTICLYFLCIFKKQTSNTNSYLGLITILIRSMWTCSTETNYCSLELLCNIHIFLARNTRRRINTAENEY